MSSEYINNRIFENIICRFQHSKMERSKYDFLLQDMRSCEMRMEGRDGWRPTEWDGRKLQYNEVMNNFHDSQKELAAAFYMLSENLVRYARFNLIDVDDAVQEGVMICFEKIDRFDPRKGKAFNYMTTCILNHFRQLYRTARNYNELKKKYLSFLQIQFEEHLTRRCGKGTQSYRSSLHSL